MKIDFSRLNAELVGRAHTLLPTWIPAGSWKGREYVGLNPKRADRTSGSFSINSQTGEWADFATGHQGGDLVSLYAYLQDLGQAEAARKLVADLGLSMNGNGAHLNGKASNPPAVKNGVEIAWPIPRAMLTEEGLPKDPPHPPQGLGEVVESAGDVYPYSTEDGAPLCYVVRFKRTDNGEKEVRPLTLWRTKADGALGWRWKFPPGKRPILGLDVLSAKSEAPVLGVEGEGKCEKARDALPDYAVISWMGGANAVGLTKWDALATRQTPIVLWPDADPAGARAMLELGRILGADRVRVVVPQSDWPLGFDIADLIGAGATRERLDEIIDGAVSLSGFAAIAAERWQVERAHRSAVTDGSGDSGEPEPPTPYSEISLSNRFVRERGADFHYTKGDWWRYDRNGGLWSSDNTLQVFTEIRRLTTRAANEMVDAAAENEQKAARKSANDLASAKKSANDLASAKKVVAVEKLSRSHPAIVTTLDQFDRDIWLLNTPGGVIELRDGTMRPTQRDDFFTKSTLVAPCEMSTPMFDRFIREVMGGHIPPTICKCAACAESVGKPNEERQEMHDAEVQRLVDYLLRLYGYCLSGDVSNHVLVMLIGDGGNGKTLLTDFIARDIFGLAPIGYSTSLPIEALLANKSDRHPTELMGLFHTRLALASEPGSGVLWNEGLVMRLTGGEPVTARRMRQDFVTFPGTHKLFVVANTAPILRAGREAAWQRRLHMLPFQQRWSQNPDPLNHVRLADATLREKLRPEAPGVLHKLILGCVEYVRRGRLDPPATVRLTSQDYLKQQNVIGRWLDERCDRSNSHEHATVADLWADFTRWAEAGREYVGRRNDFNGTLERLGIEITRLGTQRGICRGLKLLPLSEGLS